MDGFETGSVSYCHLLGSLCCILRCLKKSLKRRAAKAREEEGNGTNLHFNKYKHVNIIMLTFWIRERKFMITVGLQLLILADAFYLVQLDLGEIFVTNVNLPFDTLANGMVEFIGRCSPLFFTCLTYHHLPCRTFQNIGDKNISNIKHETLFDIATVSL